MSDWQLETAEKIGLTPTYKPVSEDFILLLLYLDGRTPLYGEEALHLCFFLYPYVSATPSPTIFLPSAVEVENGISTLKSKGLVEEGKEFKSGRYVSVLRLSDTGVAEARKVFSTFASSWVVLHGFVFRRGSEIISELEALKKTYNNRTPLELIKLLAMKIDSEGEAFVKRLGLQNERREKLIVDFARQLYRELKLLTREMPD